ncbi:hypothetical protein J3459_011536 [Metarhizium acridum]|uniref:Uncharacterized protein n=2 Tax=Metarhizium acridum TaxID=92637 RepID=E9E653_METAQ|nr:uncharacterized protein MAC_05351 [Metarhizium acridum CQMa 102]ALI93568.1 MAT1-2-3 [Metarhizium acridum]EFY88586.1 hypothetical protein MAC_05351 [Metarhizium acridum CQMa 102]KAG8415288.1 hypothetical protein J3458_009149 [Metarhizium acridum]KAG8419093.1 hypothetical protein J3459_011536 [Metarhizium acridum]
MESSDTLALPTVSALRHLEPRPGGQWAVTGQSSASYSLAYIMDGGTDAICYTMKPCTTEEDVRIHCASLIYDYSEANDTDFKRLAATPNTASGAMQLALRQKQDNRSNDSRVPGLEGLALDPLMIDPMPESQNLSFGDGQQSQLGSLDQIESQNNMFELGNGPTNQQNQPQMMGAVNGIMDWPSSETILPVMAPISQLPIVSGPVAPVNENSSLLSELWDENYDRIEPMRDDAGSHAGWPLQFAAS